MDTAPFSPRTPTAKSWWNLMRDDSDDDADSVEESSILSPKTPGSISSFWNVLSGSNHEDSELRADRYDEENEPVTKIKEIDEQQTVPDDGTVTTVSSRKTVQWQSPIHKTKRIQITKLVALSNPKSMRGEMLIFL